MPCACPRPLAPAPAPPLSSYRVDVRDRIDRRCQGACMHPAEWRIEVEKRLWNALSEAGRSLLLAHESAHGADGCAASCPHGSGGGRPCEPCTDYLAGSSMRAWGYSLARTLGAVTELAPWTGRRIRRDVEAGWRAGAAPRGVALPVSASLSKTKADAVKAHVSSSAPAEPTPAPAPEASGSSGSSGSSGAAVVVFALVLVVAVAKGLLR